MTPEIRDRLPNRRPCVRHEFELNGFRYFGAIGLRPDTGEPAELFLQSGKVGSQLEAVARDAAVMASLALQYGCPIEALRHALTRLEGGAPAGPIAALLDLLAAEEAES